MANVVALRQVREDELDALKARLARHLPHSIVVYGGLSLAARYGLHSFRPASILVPVGQHPSCFTIIAPIGSGIQSLDSIGGRQVQVHVKRKGHVYNLEAPAILDTELPPEYHISSLNENEASVVWTNWEFNFLDSEDNIRHDIAHFPSSGIRKRSLTDSAGSPQEAAKETLVSWVRTTKNGWMGNTFTLPRHRRKGLASRATLALAHQMLQEGFFAIVVIEDFNAASAKFHESLGFKRLCAIAMAVLVPAETTGQDCLE
ncbi:hypothetical protein O3P69_013664 [Scylla paramamosain]|uniref:N-acetyltransferase domain-containing protein n=1 Tax=Scylla paramamosain TaxID=85552 RepID=A0AAW0SQ12_SCYPA